MSLDVYLLKMRPATIYEANITHNLGKMAVAAGIYGHLWRPDENGITKAGQLIEPLRAGIALQLREIERLRVQVKQADERGDEAMRRAHKAESELVESALQVLAHSTQAHEHWEDAQRYQFLRNQPRRKDYYTEDANWSVSREQHGMGQVFRGAELDTAIDAARMTPTPAALTTTSKGGA